MVNNEIEETLLKAIDMALAAVDRLRDEALALESHVPMNFWNACDLTDYALHLKAEAKAKRAKASRIESVNLPRLKRRLAAVRTMFLNGFGEDQYGRTTRPNTSN